jgi:hypothetical protein
MDLAQPVARSRERQGHADVHPADFLCALDLHRADGRILQRSLLWLCARLAGTSRLGRFLSAFLAGFWLLRVALQWFYYDREVRRANRWLDALYLASLIALSFIFAWAVFAPVA